MRILTSADTDFGILLALRESRWPSVLLFRKGREKHPERQLLLLHASLPAIHEALKQGRIVIFARTQIRICSLPIEGPA